MQPLHVFPIMQPYLLEESRRELERERELQRQIREARDARRAAQPSRFAVIAAKVRRPVRSGPRPRLVEGS